MPGTTPAASQLDWLISSTTTMVLFCSKVIRERLRSSIWVMGHLHRFRTTTTVPDLCRRPHSFWTKGALGTEFVAAARAAGVFGKSAHGMRKAAATRAAENG